MLSDVTWQPLLEGRLSPLVSGPPGVAVYKEVDEVSSSTPSTPLVSKTPSKSPLSAAGRREVRASLCSSIQAQLNYSMSDSVSSVSTI